MKKLEPPVSAADHQIGRDDAAVTLVEYGDYECPHCAAAHPMVMTLIQAMGPRLRFVYRHFPLTEIHPHAQRAAESAEAAGAQGRFWQMHDLIFDNQDALDDEELLRYALAAGCDAVRVARELAGHVYMRKVRADFLSGVRSGVNGTPTFFVDGIRYDGPRDLRSMLYVLDEVAGKGVPVGAFREPARVGR
jgi:protein-disulfide isomerase